MIGSRVVEVYVNYINNCTTTEFVSIYIVQITYDKVLMSLEVVFKLVVRLGQCESISTLQNIPSYE